MTVVDLAPNWELADAFSSSERGVTRGVTDGQPEYARKREKEWNGNMAVLVVSFV